MITISKITVNYQERPVGITQIEQIGWVIASEKRNTRQASYQIQISSEASFQNILMDSKKVETSESAHRKAEGLLLQSSCKYYLRVRIWSEDGEESDWAESEFITSLLSNDEWIAKFITIESERDHADSRGSYLRKRILIHNSKKIKSAYVHATALGIYHLFLNEKKVSEDEFAPGWTSFNKHLCYQTYDVTTQLQPGANVIGAHLGAGWYKGTMGFVRMRNHYGDKTAFACQLVITYEDETKEVICTDQTWQGEWSPVLFSEIYDGECVDARAEIKDWNLENCQYPSFRECFIVEFNRAVLESQSGCKVIQKNRFPVQRLIKTPMGDTVLDFGQNLTGWVEFKAKGKKGDCVLLQCFEVLDADGNVYLDNLRTAKQTVSFIFGEEEEIIFHPNFSFQGFQFVKIIQYPGEIIVENFTAVAVHSDMEEIGDFSCSNQDVNQLWHNILWGMKGNFLDVPTDCPQRDERLGWTGDAQIFCRTASYLMDTYTFYSKWLRDVEADQTAEGGVPHVVPDILIGKSNHDRLMKDGDHSAAAWADVAVILPWTLYQVYGDTSVIERQYNSMKAWIDFMQKHANDYIWNYKLQFGDWVALDAEEGSYFGATPNDLTCTAYFAYSTRLFYKMARVIGRMEDAKCYESLYERIVASYQKTFFGEDGRLTVQTQTAQIITLYFELAPVAYKKNVTEDLLALLKKEKGHLVTGFVGTPYFCHALSQNGHTKEAYELLLKDDFPSWLYQVKKGATTIWEHWDGLKEDGTMWSPDMNSFNHYAYGAVGEWMTRVAVGIEIDEKNPGYQHSIIAPHVSDEFSCLGGSYESQYGKISSRWKLEGEIVTLTVEIPCNTTATVKLWNAGEVVESDGLFFVANTEGQIADAGSGSYTIVYKISS